MAIAYRHHTVVTGTESSELVTTKPTGLTAGDMMAVFFMSSDVPIAGAISRTGWTVIKEANNGATNGFTCLAKVADAGDVSASTYTFTYSGSFTGKTFIGIHCAYSGTFTSTVNIVSSDGEYDADAGDNDIAEFEGGVTPTSTSMLLFFVGGQCTNGSTSSLSGWAVTTNNPSWTEKADGAFNDTSADIRYGFAEAPRTATTATGDWQVNFNSTGNLAHAFGALLALQENESAAVTGTGGEVTIAGAGGTATGGANVTGTGGEVTIAGAGGTVTTPSPQWINTPKS